MNEKDDLRIRAQEFYNSIDLSSYGRSKLEYWEPVIKGYLHNSKPSMIIELGSGKTEWSFCGKQCISVDIGREVLVSKNTLKVQTDMQKLPFKDGSLEFVFSIAALEHVPFPELVLEEISRTLSKNSIAILAPAWFCRPWAAKGLPIKPYSDLSWLEKINKASLVIRNNKVWRGIGILALRIIREFHFAFSRDPLPFYYRRLKPNLDEFIMSDSDAFTSMDPHSMILYFLSRGFQVEQGKFPRRLVSHFKYLTITKKN